MIKQYRIITNGTKFKIERLCKRRFLWWSWETWRLQGVHCYDDFSPCGFDTRIEAEEAIKIQILDARPWKVVTGQSE